MKKAYIFDLDGTIVDSLGAIANCANFCLEEQGFASHELEAYKDFIGDGQYELIKRALRAAGDINLEKYEVTMARYIELFEHQCHIGCEAYDGIKEMLFALKENGIKLAVLSNKAHKNTIKVVEYVFGEGFFDEIQGQLEHVKRKPSPDGVFMIMEKLGVKAEECVYVGDTCVDMQTGKSAGIFSVGVTWGFRDRAELEEYHADAIVDKAQELLAYQKMEIELSNSMQNL